MILKRKMWYIQVVKTFFKSISISGKVQWACKKDKNMSNFQSHKTARRGQPNCCSEINYMKNSTQSVTKRKLITTGQFSSNCCLSLPVVGREDDERDSEEEVRGQQAFRSCIALTTYSLHLSKQVIDVILLWSFPELVVTEFIYLLLLVEYIILRLLGLVGLLKVSNQTVGSSEGEALRHAS